MTNLRHLDIDHNRLEGSISSGIQGLTNLRFLQLDNNLFTGTIPSEMGLATNLSKCN
jgi:Leucine-rich repeat (LRR) protein